MNPKPVWSNPFIVIDLETTGFSEIEDSIIQIAAVRFEDGMATDSWQTLVHPGDVEIPLQVQRLTGITEADVQGQPSLAQSISELSEWIGSATLMAHNAAFEQKMLHAACRRVQVHDFPNQFFDTLSLSRVALPAIVDHRLTTLCAHYDIPLDDAHNALHDAQATGYLFYFLMDELIQYHPESLQMVLHFAKLDPNLSQLLAWARDRSLSQFHGSLSTRPKIALPKQESSQSSARTPDRAIEADLGEVFGPQGEIARHLPHFEPRLQQLQFARDCATALRDEQFLLAEAGTGTGKSLGYLVPAILNAKQTGKRIVISTHTIALQEQIWDKEIPFLQSLPSFDFEAKILKGRNHYLCLSRWDEICQRTTEELSIEQQQLYARIPTWLARTESGDRAELNLNRMFDAAWQEIAADRDSCTGQHCPFAGRCYLLKAKQEAEQSDLLIVNHALLVSDFQADHRVLPEYSSLIVDEAHHLNAVASDHLGVRLMAEQWFRLYRRFAQKKSTLARISSEQDRESIVSAWERSNGYAQEFWTFLNEWVSKHVAHSPSQERKYELRLPKLQDDSLSEADFTDRWQAVTENWLLGLEELRTILNKLENSDVPESATREAAQLSAGVQHLIELIRAIDLKDEAIVAWVERNTGVWEREPRLVLRTAPLHAGMKLSEHWEQIQSAIFASATLTVAGDFRYMQKQLGLSKFTQKLSAVAYDSPFDYSEQALLCLADDFVSPKGSANNQRYVEQTSQFLTELAQVTLGRTLVLFTSHSMLRQVYSSIKPTLENTGLILLGQNIDGTRSRLLQTFRQEPNSLLFGSNSFWEGVDLPGDCLACVVMVKLPFSPPGHPLYQARLEALEQQGVNSFQKMSLPEAVLRFKQGFGRLIRTRTDSGAVIVLDPRLVQANRYGQAFLKSLPQPAVYKGSRTEIIKRVQSWLTYLPGSDSKVADI